MTVSHEAGNTLPGQTASPLARLVRFMACLCLAGAVVAGVHYLIVDLPLQNEVLPPVNSAGTACWMRECINAPSFYGCYCECAGQKCGTSPCKDWKVIPDTWRR